MNIKIGRNEIQTDKKLFIPIGIYLVTLFIVYYYDLSHLYAYSLMTYNPNFTKLGIAIILILGTVIVLPRNEHKPSTYLYYTFYIITYLPTMMFYWMNDKPTIYVIYETVCFAIVAILVGRTYKTFKIKAERGKILIDLVFFVYIILCLILVLRNGGINLRAIVEDLYQVRSENNLSGIFGYFLNWCAKSFMPFFFIYFYLKRNFKAVILVSVLQVLLFLSYGFKAFLMAVFMLFFVSFLMRNNKTFMRNITLSFSAAIILSMIVYWAGSLILLNLFPYRTLLLPSQGQFGYYDFFTHNRFLYFSEGSVGRLLGIEYPYSQQIGRVVNVFVYGPQKLSNGNTGILSYGFADLGFAGMILASIIIGIVFNMIDSATRDLPIIIPVSAMAYQMFTLNDNNMLICLNTGGILWSIIMLILLNSVYASIKSNDSGRLIEI